MKIIFQMIIFLYSPCPYMRAWIHVLDAPSCYECTAQAERKSALYTKLRIGQNCRAMYAKKEWP